VKTNYAITAKPAVVNKADLNVILTAMSVRFATIEGRMSAAGIPQPIIAGGGSNPKPYNTAAPIGQTSAITTPPVVATTLNPNAPKGTSIVAPVTQVAAQAGLQASSLSDEQAQFTEFPYNLQSLPNVVTSTPGSSVPGTPTTTDDIPEGSTNMYAAPPSVTTEAFAASPYTPAPTANVINFYLVSASSGAPFVFDLPPATGSFDMIIVKKMDANAQSVNVTPNGTDTIDGVNAAVDITIQYDVLRLVDGSTGAWSVW